MLLPAPDEPSGLRIGRWTLHPDADELRLGELKVKLEPRLTRVLLCLSAHAGEVVSAQALRDAVWGRVQVTAGSLHEAVSRLRMVLAADAHGPSYIDTVARRGYRLAAPVQHLVPMRADGPRLVVLPFDVTGLEPGLRSLRERLLDGLIAALSRQSGCRVLARGSALVLGQQAGAAQRAGSRIGARYRVEGRIDAAGPQLSVSAELVDGPSGELPWHGCIDCAPADGPVLAAAVVGQLARSLSLQIRRRLASDASHALGPARRLAMQAWVELFCRPQSAAVNQTAWDYSQRALAQDGDDVLGLVSRAYAGFRAANYGWQGLPRASTMAAALRDAERALLLQPEQHDAHFVMAMLVSDRGEHMRAEAALRHCVQLVPDLAPAWGNLGWLRITRGQPAEAAPLCAHALALSPLDPMRAVWHWHRSRAALDLGQPELALDAAQQALAANPELPGGYLCGLMAAQQLGRRELVPPWLAWVAAHPRYATVVRIRANYAGNSDANCSHRESLEAALGRAGLPAC